MKTAKQAMTRAVVCTQWGDTGKGKFIDVYAEEADIIARGTGGANAGHTIRFGKKEFIFHLVPSGIVRAGKINIIGNGVVLDPRILCEELEVLCRSGVGYKDRLFLALNAKLVLPQHLVMDRVRESNAKKGKIGTTGRGIGPCYADYYNRIGLTVNDLLNPGLFADKLEENLKEKFMLLREYDPRVVKKIMHHEHLERGRFYSKRGFFDIDEIISAYRAYGRALSGLIRDTDGYLREAVGKKRVLLEGAQGTLLSIDYGTYPFVTSSDCAIEGLAKGVGLRVSDVDQVLGIAKAFYMTRVGEGPFPTEMGGKDSAEWCGSGAKRKDEEARYAHVSIESKNEFEFGIAVRIAGSEYGATTGRPRRTGWLDLPLLRYARGVNGPDVILTKLDVLSHCPEIRLCTSYVYEGPRIRLGDRFLEKGDILERAIPAAEILEYCSPRYEALPGWQGDVSGARSWGELPKNFRRIVRFVEERSDVRARVLSVGPDREQTIFL